MPNQQAPRSNIPVISSVADLALALSFDEGRLRYYVRSKRQYKTFNIPKKAGGTRRIEAPFGVLKDIQVRLNKLLQAAYGRRAPVHAYVQGRSCVTNARKHLGVSTIFNIDLLDFFGSIHFGRVEGLLMAKPYNFPKPVARFMTRICCEGGRLPQGAPTSPVVSNMVAAEMDADLKALARSLRCTYTRYADDITFSTEFGRFPDGLVSQDANGLIVCGSLLQQVLDNHKFKVNQKKVRLAKAGSHKEVTGVIVGDRFTNVRRSFVRTTRCMMHALEKFKEADAQREFIARYDKRRRKEVCFREVVRGRIEYVGQVRGRDTQLYTSLVGRFIKAHEGASVKPITVSSTCEDAILHRTIYILRATDGDGLERLSTAFVLSGVGVVTACHAVRDPDSGELYGNLKIFTPPPRLEEHRVRLVRFSSHHDLAVLEFEDKPALDIGLVSSGAAGSMRQVRIFGYPRFNVGAQITCIPAHVIRVESYQGIQRLITDGTINEGNSGGPLLNENNEVVAIAVEGKNVTDNRSVYVRHVADATEKPPAAPQKLLGTPAQKT